MRRSLFAMRMIAMYPRVFKLIAKSSREAVLSFKNRIHHLNWIERRLAIGKPPRGLPAEILDAPYCFVISTGRCGTELLTRLLSEAPELFVKHAPKPELEYVSSKIHAEKPSIECLSYAILAARFDVYFQYAFERGLMYVETNNRITFFAEALADILPNARFIHLVRNPASFVRSGMRRGYYDGKAIQHQRLIFNGLDPKNELTRLQKIALEWNEINSYCEHFKKGEGSDRVITLNSESLFSQAAVTHRIFEFLGVGDPFDSVKGKRRLSRILGAPVNAQVTGNFPAYNDWSELQKRELRGLATLAECYGYDLS